MIKKRGILLLAAIAGFAYVRAQQDSAVYDSLLLKKAEQMALEYNSSDAQFEKGVGTNSGLVHHQPTSTIMLNNVTGTTPNAANPWNAQTPMEAIIVGTMNEIFRVRKK
jgi:hypothetical protein